MIDALGPGLFGPYLLLELAILVYVIFFLRPGFPFLRVISYGIGFYVLFLVVDFLGPNWVRYLVENIWSFIVRDLARVL